LLFRTYVLRLLSMLMLTSPPRPRLLLFPRLLLLLPRPLSFRPELLSFRPPDGLVLALFRPPWLFDPPELGRLLPEFGRLWLPPLIEGCEPDEGRELLCRLLEPDEG
jgi:hypothetical protein